MTVHNVRSAYSQKNNDMLFAKHTTNKKIKQYEEDLNEKNYCFWQQTLI